MTADAVTRFCEALWKDDRATVTRLVARIDPNGADRWQRTALAMAARYAELAVVERLLVRGARADQGRRFATPLLEAVRRGAADIAATLRGAGAQDSIVTAVWLGDRRRVAQELARDPALAALVDEDGTPILHHAAEALGAEIAAALLDRGAPPAAADRTGETALHRVADLRRDTGEPGATMAALLIDRGAAVDARNRDDVTPLHQAVRARNLAVVRTLLDRGADPNARDKRGSTPLHRAVAGTGASSTAGIAACMPELVEVLVAHGADPDREDTRGRTPRAAARSREVRAALASRPGR